MVIETIETFNLIASNDSFKWFHSQFRVYFCHHCSSAIMLKWKQSELKAKSSNFSIIWLPVKERPIEANKFSSEPQQIERGLIGSFGVLNLILNGKQRAKSLSSSLVFRLHPMQSLSLHWNGLCIETASSNHSLWASRSLCLSSTQVQLLRLGSPLFSLIAQSFCSAFRSLLLISTILKWNR